MFFFVFKLRNGNDFRSSSVNKNRKRPGAATTQVRSRPLALKSVFSLQLSVYSVITLLPLISSD